MISSANKRDVDCLIFRCLVILPRLDSISSVLEVLDSFLHLIVPTRGLVDVLFDQIDQIINVICRYL
jgi:hypothetical protein